jgi:ribosomal protein L40E
LAKAHGLKPEEEVKETKLSPKTCPRCKTKNPATAMYCSTCSMVLDQQEALKIDIEGKLKGANELMAFKEGLEEMYRKLHEFEQRQAKA